MPSDLGTWNPAQAEALVRALEEEGITPTVERTPSGTRVSVDAPDAERASRVMAARMDEIARAAGPRHGNRQPRWYEEEDDEENGPPLFMERFRQMGTVLAVLVAGLMVAFYVPGPFRVVAAILTFVVIGIFVARGRRDDGQDRYGPGA